LPDPPGGIGGEAESTFWIELLDGMNQPKVALFDQIEQRETAVGVVLGDVHNQPQVVLDHFLARIEAAALRQACVMDFFGRGQQMVVTDLVEVDLRHIRQQIGARVVVLGGRLVLRQIGFFADIVG
jgi:hypothetical protein